MRRSSSDRSGTLEGVRWTMGSPFRCVISPFSYVGQLFDACPADRLMILPRLTSQDCLYGMYKALDCGLIDLSTFDPDEYAFYERVENGDFNWVAKDFIAFASPHDNAFVRALNTGTVDELGSGRGLRKRSKGYQMLLDYFEKNGVGLVVRLNNPLYDKRDFESRGIEFKDMCASPSAAFCLIRHIDLISLASACLLVFEDGTNVSHSYSCSARDKD